MMIFVSYSGSFERQSFPCCQSLFSLLISLRIDTVRLFATITIALDAVKHYWRIALDY